MKATLCAVLVLYSCIALASAWDFTFSLNEGPFNPAKAILSDIQFTGLPQINSNYIYCAFLVDDVEAGDDIIYPPAPAGFQLAGYENWPDYWLDGGYVKFIRITSSGTWDLNVFRNWMLSVKFQSLGGNTHPRKVWFDIYSGPSYFWMEKRQTLKMVPSATCGNGVKETGEDCDGGVCCADNCKFKTAGTVCRAIAGECDLAEVCSGSSATCPTDAFKSNTAVCGEKIGFCDTRVDNTCPGNGPNCNGVPYLRLGTESFFFDTTWENYNVISFGSYGNNNGQVEGRLAVKGNAVLGDFSLGYAVDTTASGKDKYVPYGLIVGGNASWRTGTLWPDSSVSHPSATEFATVAGTFTGATELVARQLHITYDSNGVIIPNPNIATEFTKAETFYTNLQIRLAGLARNAVAEAKWGGMFVRCNSASDSVYFVDVEAADLSASTWWSLENCNYAASYVLNVKTGGDVIVKGGDFPAVTEKVIYNVLGSGRVFNTTSGLKGNILAPKNTVIQFNGDTRGLIIAGDMPQALHARNPNCIKYDTVKITGRVAGDVQVKNKRAETTDVPVYSAGGFIEGDQVVMGGQTVAINKAFSSNGVTYLTVSPALTVSLSKDSEFSTTVDPSTAGPRGPIQVTPVDPVDTNAPDASSDEDEDMDSAASSFGISAVVFAILAAMMMMM